MISELFMDLKKYYPMLDGFSTSIDNPLRSRHCVTLNRGSIEINFHIDEVEKYVDLEVKQKSDDDTGDEFYQISVTGNWPVTNKKVYDIFAIVDDNDLKANIFTWYRKRRHTPDEMRTFASSLYTLVEKLLEEIEEAKSV